MEYEYLHFPAAAVQVDPLRFVALPESARRVFAEVKARGPLTHKELREATGLPPRTLRYAVKRLKDDHFIDTRCSLRDCRTCYFFVNKRCVGVEALEAARRKAEETRQTRPVEGEADALL